MRGLAALAAIGALGCLSPIALDRAVLDYDRTVNRAEAELLLLNIVRARHHRPIHFTAVSSIAATYDLRVQTGLLGRLGPRPKTPRRTCCSREASPRTPPSRSSRSRGRSSPRARCGRSRSPSSTSWSSRTSRST